VAPRLAPRKMALAGSAVQPSPFGAAPALLWSCGVSVVMRF
jgi:hypothetical protein